MGYVYVISDGTGLYKIGRSMNVAARRATLQREAPTPLAVVHTIETPTSHRCEYLLHERYARHRVHGEWFRLPPHDLSDIKRLTAEPPSWLMVIEYEPRLVKLLKAAKSFGRKGGRTYCANAVWYGYEQPWGRGLKHRMERLVGHLREADDPIPLLRTAVAYDLAYDTIYNALPDCRHELGMCG